MRQIFWRPVYQFRPVLEVVPKGGRFRSFEPEMELLNYQTLASSVPNLGGSTNFLSTGQIWNVRFQDLECFTWPDGLGERHGGMLIRFDGCWRGAEISKPKVNPTSQ